LYYERIDNFDDYRFFNSYEMPGFYEKKISDRVNDINGQTPILIRKRLVIGFGVEDVPGKFDKNSFILFLSATKRRRM
jgi:hypothetical protein